MEQKHGVWVELQERQDDNQSKYQDASKDVFNKAMMLRQGGFTLAFKPALTWCFHRAVVNTIFACAVLECAVHGCWMSASNQPIAAAATVMMIAGFMNGKD